MDARLKNIYQRLARVYGAEQAPAIYAEIVARIIATPRIAGGTRGWSERDALLITYADSLLGDAPPLRVLDTFLREEVGELISFVHLLPFFPFTSDDGFAVSDFRAVREDLGEWADVARLAERYRLVFDWVLNHASASSGYMQDYCAGEPEYANFFLALDPATDTSAVLRTRNLPLLHDYPTHDGIKWLWTTFSRDQVDLNYANPRVLLEMLDVLLGYAARGASVLRLDAVPYLWKELGTSCAHLPQTHELIKLFRDVLEAAAPHVLLLTETNVPHRENVVYFGEGGNEAQMIYNFALPPLILWSLHTGDVSVLREWAREITFISPRATYLNITATHDGIGVRPTEGILSHAERMELVQLAYDHDGDVTGKRNSDGYIAPYELNLNYFDAVNDPRAGEPLDLQIRRFLVSQAIPLAMLGIPGLYIHSLLGSRNDLAGVARTGRARSINREQLPLAALLPQLHDPTTLRGQVFAALCRLLRLRAHQPAFHPDAAQEILDAGPACFALRRHAPAQTLTALHNVTNHPLTLAGIAHGHDLLADEAVGPAIALAPYQVRWVVE